MDPSVRQKSSPVSSKMGNRDSWHESLARAIRDPDVLFERLGLPTESLEPARRASQLFPLFVPESFLQRMEPGNLADPLLMQVLPLDVENWPSPGAAIDAVGDTQSRRAPGLLHKYHGRALMIATGVCAVHCRYCFRRHYQYELEPRRLDEWEPALEVLSRDESIQEVLLSGGDPLMLTDSRLTEIIRRLEIIPHLKRLRIHSRMPIVLPNRVSQSLIELLTGSRLTPIMVVHANHPREIAGDCEQSLRQLVRSGITTLNQSVLLRGINDNADTLTELSERLINVGVIPYYLHQLDLVQGTTHFQVDESAGQSILAELRTRLPGYAVPQYVRELPGQPHKTPL
ncbi:EF-P beta-lysylation protein EpmB [Schlesneria sp.]|uniref:EF-P beta-lysylation protein EpmB n=1 Tax=Schlesneria sp. TaxID=2762018 RepID=UPI002F12134C